MVRTESFDFGKVKFELFVRGNPKTKGSFNPIISKYPSKKTGKHYVFMMESGTEKSKEERKSWMKTVTDAVWAEWDRQVDQVLDDVPIRVDLIFYLRRGKTVKRERPHTKAVGDKDKLERLVLDCLTKAGVYNDDAQVCEGETSKFYDDKKPSGVLIQIAEI